MKYYYQFEIDKPAVTPPPPPHAHTHTHITTCKNKIQLVQNLKHERFAN